MFGIGGTELVVIFVLALLVFGPKRLPEIGRAIAQGLKMFKEASREVRESFSDVQAEFDQEIRKAEDARREITRALLEDNSSGEPPDSDSSSMPSPESSDMASDDYETPSEEPSVEADTETPKPENSGSQTPLAG
jgi:TatA/E family protein of Tat protein translocase